MTEGLVRSKELASHHQPEEFGKGQKETPVRVTYQPPRTLFAGIHLGWAMRVPPRKTLSQNDWPETTWKWIPSPWPWRLRALWQSWVLLPSCSPSRCPFPKKPLVLSAWCLLRWPISWCYPSTHYGALVGIPLPATKPSLVSPIMQALLFTLNSIFFNVFICYFTIWLHLPYIFTATYLILRICKQKRTECCSSSSYTKG